MAETSKLKDLVTFLGSIKGDLANITSPPHLLAPQSVTEVSSAWTERPSIFVAPALEPDAQKRALLVTKWILTSLKSQYNVGDGSGSVESGGSGGGIKKPLNAFLGELFFGEWTENGVTSRITTEQVSHHPPVTASYLWNNEYGIRGEGYTRVEMTFDGSVNIKQNGHAMVHIDRYDEDYLIPVPDAKVKGFLSGSLHLELDGIYHIVSSTGFVTEIRFSNKGLFSSSKQKNNSFEADLYRRDDAGKKPLYTIRGQWDGTFEFRDCTSDTVIEVWDSDKVTSAKLQIANIEEQDPWESRRAWQHVLDAVHKGDTSAIATEKSKIEDAQRSMRKVEAEKGETWSPLFFFCREKDDYSLFDQLSSGVGWDLRPEKTAGIWRADRAKAENPKAPSHGNLTPLG